VTHIVTNIRSHTAESCCLRFNAQTWAARACSRFVSRPAQMLLSHAQPALQLLALLPAASAALVAAPLLGGAETLQAGANPQRPAHVAVAAM
jgi:hypothetical protein